MKIELFTDCTPNNYNQEDNMKHYQFKDYKHLKNVDFDGDEESPLLKILGGLAFILVLYTLIFLSTI